MSKNEKTSTRIARIASRLLRDGRTSRAVKSVAASVLTQTPDRRRRSR